MEITSRRPFYPQEDLTPSNQCGHPRRFPHAELLRGIDDEMAPADIIAFLQQAVDRIVPSRSCPCLFCTGQSTNPLLVFEEAFNSRYESWRDGSTTQNNVSNVSRSMMAASNIKRPPLTSSSVPPEKTIQVHDLVSGAVVSEDSRRRLYNSSRPSVKIPYSYGPDGQIVFHQSNPANGPVQTVQQTILAEALRSRSTSRSAPSSRAPSPVVKMDEVVKDEDRNMSMLPQQSNGPSRGRGGERGRGSRGRARGNGGTCRERNRGVMPSQTQNINAEQANPAPSPSELAAVTRTGHTQSRVTPVPGEAPTKPSVTSAAGQPHPSSIYVTSLNDLSPRQLGLQQKPVVPTSIGSNAWAQWPPAPSTYNTQQLQAYSYPQAQPQQQTQPQPRTQPLPQRLPRRMSYGSQYAQVVGQQAWMNSPPRPSHGGIAYPPFTTVQQPNQSTNPAQSLSYSANSSRITPVNGLNSSQAMPLPSPQQRLSTPHSPRRPQLATPVLSSPFVTPTKKVKVSHPLSSPLPAQRASTFSSPVAQPQPQANPQANPQAPSFLPRRINTQAELGSIRIDSLPAPVLPLIEIDANVWFDGHGVKWTRRWDDQWERYVGVMGG